MCPENAINLISSKACTTLDLNRDVDGELESTKMETKKYWLMYSNASSVVVFVVVVGGDGSGNADDDVGSLLMRAENENMTFLLFPVDTNTKQF